MLLGKANPLPADPGRKTSPLPKVPLALTTDLG